MVESITLQKALYTIKKLKKLVEKQPLNAFQPIAIVGLSCRFPQAMNKEAYWQLLADKRNVISPMPEQRWQLLQNTDEISLRDANHPYWGGYLDAIIAFDAYFFGISPREATRMDPQQRLLLEVAYEAIEDAGFPLETLEGSNTGVFTSLYASQLASLQTLGTNLDALYLPTGNATSIAANRLSYLFDLHGPSIVIDTACSSSLVALHLACLNLQNKACDLALVCGVNINLLPSINFVLAQAKMLSPEGQCKTFDATANGYVPGEGVGVIMLKPLAKAIEDQDKIYAVVTGSAINQDGKTNGLTAPNGLSQEALILSACRVANVDPQEIGYVECHGTGTFLGDPIEIQALGEIVGKKRDAHKPCWIGSVKTNIGHLEPAAGIASIIKVALALQHSQIPPHLNFSTPNPHIAFDKYHFRIPQQVEEWPIYGDYRLAGISSFGFGGTNAHVILREFSDQQNPALSCNEIIKQNIFVLSAKDPVALSYLVNKWCVYLESNSSLELTQICYNTHLRRSHYFYRLAIIAHTTKELSILLSKVKDQALAKLENTGNIFLNIDKAATNLVNISDMETAIAENNLTKLAMLYVNRASINWKEYNKNNKYPHIDMPLYPWQHKNYWPLLKKPSKENKKIAVDVYPLQGKQIVSPLPTLQFEFKFSTQVMSEIGDTYNILHAGYYLEMLAFVIDKLYQRSTFSIEDMVFLSPLLVLDNTSVTVQLILEKLQNDSFFFTCYAQTNNQNTWITHAKGKLFLEEDTDKKIGSIDKIKQRFSLNKNADLFYSRIKQMGMPAGNSIRWTNKYGLDEQEILCEFSAPSMLHKNETFKLNIHPGIIDACIQPIFMLLPDAISKAYTTSNIKKFRYFGVKTTHLYLLSTLQTIHSAGEQIVGGWYLFDLTGKIVAECEGLSCVALNNTTNLEEIIQAQAQNNLDLAQLSPQDRKQQVLNFLVEKVAAILAMPKEDVVIQASLRDMGIDSLMAIALVKVIEIGLGAIYSMQMVLQGPSIIEIADFILVEYAQKETIPSTNNARFSNPWLVYKQRRANPKLRLFCFPYGGGGASIYYDWQRYLPEFIEVCPIQLPGREERMEETSIAQIDVLVNQLIENLHAELDLPFAFFGHSFGSLIAFALAHKLRKLNLPQPVHLFASAFPDPRDPTQSLDSLLQECHAINLASLNTAIAVNNLQKEQLNSLVTIFKERGFIEYSNLMVDTDLIKFLLPIFINDMSIVKSYQYDDELALDLPITVFAGKHDTWVSYKECQGWVVHTKKKCEIHELNGGHLFIKEEQCKKEILHKIANAFK